MPTYSNCFYLPERNLRGFHRLCVKGLDTMCLCTAKRLIQNILFSKCQKNYSTGRVSLLFYQNATWNLGVSPANRMYELQRGSMFLSKDCHRSRQTNMFSSQGIECCLFLRRGRHQANPWRIDCSNSGCRGLTACFWGATAISSWVRRGSRDFKRTAWPYAYPTQSLATSKAKKPTFVVKSKWEKQNYRHCEHCVLHFCCHLLTAFVLTCVLLLPSPAALLGVGNESAQSY